MTGKDKLIIDAFKLIMPRIIEMLVAESETDDEHALMKRIMAETLVLAASLHRDAGGGDLSFVTMAQDTILMIQECGATKQ